MGNKNKTTKKGEKNIASTKTTVEKYVKLTDFKKIIANLNKKNKTIETDVKELKQIAEKEKLNEKTTTEFWIKIKKPLFLHIFSVVLGFFITFTYVTLTDKFVLKTTLITNYMLAFPYLITIIIATLIFLILCYNLFKKYYNVELFDRIISLLTCFILPIFYCVIFYVFNKYNVPGILILIVIIFVIIHIFIFYILNIHKYQKHYTKFNWKFMSYILLVLIILSLGLMFLTNVYLESNITYSFSNNNCIDINFTENINRLNNYNLKAKEDCNGINVTINRPIDTTNLNKNMMTCSDNNCPNPNNNQIILGIKDKNEARQTFIIMFFALVAFLAYFGKDILINKP